MVSSAISRADKVKSRSFSDFSQKLLAESTVVNGSEMRNIANEIRISFKPSESVVSRKRPHGMHHDVMVAGKEILSCEAYAVSVRVDDLDLYLSAGALMDSRRVILGDLLPDRPWCVVVNEFQR